MIHYRWLGRYRGVWGAVTTRVTEPRSACAGNDSVYQFGFLRPLLGSQWAFAYVRIYVTSYMYHHICIIVYVPSWPPPRVPLILITRTTGRYTHSSACVSWGHVTKVQFEPLFAQYCGEKKTTRSGFKVRNELRSETLAATDTKATPWIILLLLIRHSLSMPCPHWRRLSRPPGKALSHCWNVSK